MYIDVDGVNRTYNNSSQALLSIPSTAVIKWAGIYSQGYLNGTNITTIGNAINTPIYVTVPSVGTIASTPTVIDMLANGTDGYTYDTYAPLNSLIGKTGAQINGWVTGANIKADTGTENSGLGNYGAWVLAIVYEDPNDTLKNISIFDGYKKISSGGNSSVAIPVSGFKTPLNGKVFSNLSLFVGEGDANIAGDKLYLNGTAINSTNAFYSTLMGVTANPSFTNNEGIDIQTHGVGVDGDNSHKQIIGTNQTNATITFTTTGDTYFPSLTIFSTEIYSPAIGNFDKNATVTYASNSSCSIGKDLRGATIHYSMTFQNTGTEAASNVKVYDDFQSNNILSYLDMNQTTIPTVQLLSGTGASTVTCDKNSTAIYCNFDRIAINTQYKISFDVKVKSSLSTANDITLTNTANAHYYNASTGDEITQIATSNMQMAGGICAILPVADYRFDECSWKGISGEVSDSSGNGYNGSINQALTTSSGGALCQTTIFNGTSQYISVPQTATNTLLSTASLSFWIKTTQTGNDTDWLAPGVTGVEQAGTNNDIFWGWLDGSGKIGLNALGDGVQAKSSISINDGTWRHIVLTRDASTGLLQIYINGVLDTSGMGGIGTVGTAFSSIGRIEDTGGTPAYFSGSLDEVKIFDRVLSQDEIATIYSNESAGDNFNGSVRTCNDCTIIPTAVAFDAWDIFRSISDRKISTKIVGKDFNLAVTSLDQTLSALQSFNGTVCVQLLTFVKRGVMLPPIHMVHLIFYKHLMIQK
jgi:hypothetical protein